MTTANLSVTDATFREVFRRLTAREVGALTWNTCDCCCEEAYAFFQMKGDDDAAICCEECALAFFDSPEWAEVQALGVEAAAQVDHYAFYLEPHHTAFRYDTLDELNRAVAYAQQHDKAHAAFVIFTDGTRKAVAL